MICDLVSREEAAAESEALKQKIRDLEDRIKRLEKPDEKHEGLNLYESVPAFAKKVGLADRTVKRRVEEMSDFVGPDKTYPEKVFYPGEGCAFRFLTDAMFHFERNRARLLNPEMAKFVEPYQMPQ